MYLSLHDLQNFSDEGLDGVLALRSSKGPSLCTLAATKTPVRTEGEGAGRHTLWGDDGGEGAFQTLTWSRACVHV